MRLLLTIGMLAMAILAAHAGITAQSIYTERGQTDFDTFLQVLNPYGRWEKIGDRWAYTPSDHAAPYTHGRWLYTDFGWYWKGDAPHSFATEHYGFWKRGANHVWSWFPGAFWLPETVELRQTSTHIGWRSAEVDESGVFVEAPLDRYSHEDEWIFLTRAQFANPITPAVLAAPDVAKVQLEESTDCRHSYLTYRAIDRPGPHPADLAPLDHDGRMLAPLSVADELQAKAALAQRANGTGTNAAAARPPNPDDDVPKPKLLGQDDDSTQTADPRKVKYWVTMSLPSYWAQPPATAKPDELYIYRPDLFQDQDGIERRITLWFNPNQRTTLQEALGENHVDAPAPQDTAPGTPAERVEVPTSENPFASPLDSRFHGAGASTNALSPAPAGLKEPK
jgi:hypothetical protein